MEFIYLQLSPYYMKAIGSEDNWWVPIIWTCMNSIIWTVCPPTSSDKWSSIVPWYIALYHHIKRENAVNPLNLACKVGILANRQATLVSLGPDSPLEIGEVCEHVEKGHGIPVFQNRRDLVFVRLDNFKDVSFCGGNGWHTTNDQAWIRSRG